MHVHGHAGVVLQPVGGDPSGSDLAQTIDRAPTSEQLWHAVGTLDVRHQRDHDDQSKLRLRSELLYEDPRDIVPPEVLVLDVDDALRPPYRLGVAVGDA